MVASYKDGTIQVDDELSVEYNQNTLTKGTVQVTELDRDQAVQYSRNSLRYSREPQRSISFTIKEMYGASGHANKVWQSFFGPSAQVGEIWDDDSSEIITNTSYITGSPAYNKLCLSSYERKFPEGTCTYKFGTISSITLADNTAQTANTFNAPRVQV